MREKAISEQTIRKKKETFKKIEHQKGNKNSMYGMMWITNGIDNTRIKKENPIPVGWKKGRRVEYPNGNSMKGCCWITNGFDSARIKNGDKVPEGWRKGRKVD